MLPAKATVHVRLVAAQKIPFSIDSGFGTKSYPSLVNHLVSVELEPEVSAWRPHVVALRRCYHVAEELHVLMRLSRLNAYGTDWVDLTKEDFGSS